MLVISKPFEPGPFLEIFFLKVDTAIPSVNLSHMFVHLVDKIKV